MTTPRLRRLARGLCLVALCLGLVRCGGQPIQQQTPPAGPSPVASDGPPVIDVPAPPPPVGGAAVMVGAGDIAACDGGADATARLLDGIPGTVFTLGDHAYPRGADPEFQACYEPTWGRHKARTRPSPGNHDYESPAAGPYYAYFGANAGPPGQGYYSYDVGAWHVVALNSVANIPAQVAWLQQDLDVNRHRCTLAYWHAPLYSSGPHGSAVAVRDLWRVLYRAGAEVVLNGDAHMYERFAPQDHEGQLDLTRGIRQFVVGTGGAPLHGSREAQVNSEVLIFGFGVLKLTLEADGYAWEFVPVSGRGDSGSARCH